MRCPDCDKGELIEKTIPVQDFSRVLGVPVLVHDAPGLQCEACGAVHQLGTVINTIIPWLAAEMAQVSDLGAAEARFLRKTLDLTQAELAEKLHISRSTVARWEDSGDGGLKGADSYALRSLVFMHFLDIDTTVAEEIFASLKRTPRGFPPQQYKMPFGDDCVASA